MTDEQLFTIGKVFNQEMNRWDVTVIVGNFPTAEAADHFSRQCADWLVSISQNNSGSYVRVGPLQ